MSSCSKCSNEGVNNDADSLTVDSLTVDSVTVDSVISLETIPHMISTDR